MSSNHLNYTMSALTFLGGVMGYAKAKSMPSLIAGTTFALLYAATGVAMEKDPQTGHAATAGRVSILRNQSINQYNVFTTPAFINSLLFFFVVISVVLTGAMGKRAIKTGKVFPAGVVATAAGLTTLYSAKKYYDWTYGV
ncbi:transmembrane protein 14 B [Heterostelium album PN500]|uniref:Transmembrane protein 14 B n=1 Tax=Heterostelium pallidum (strain ATCC 26659 / Pp 5 / PN500) TaxID=670386 RepID=D3B5B3_HETP5|nr:transmembrane protein 14 B [Heterostelium album PN500]EFA83478.1 transmembrane protein 14 B [Heterostelium album PN500]|eukprot:XP_020435595.1 transmembrane protein 14 B [Heterostelium album PN500]